MFSHAAKLVLTSTAIVPVGFTYAWMAYADGAPTTARNILVSCIFLLILGIGLIQYATWYLEFSPLNIVSVEAADRENTSFLLLYLLPLFTDKFSNLNWSVWIPTIVIFAILTATGYNYHVNPLIGMFGWHFYKIESTGGITYVLITRRHLRTASGTLKVAQLTEYILIEHGGK